MQSPIRVGIVGCGKIADCHHVPSYLGLEGVQITALCDIVPEKMQARQAKVPGAVLFDDYRRLFASGLVDAVSICTPNDLHSPMAQEACAAGLHVLCEKPMAATLEEATAMIRAARRARVVLQINQSMRYSREYQTVVALVREGAIGDPIHVRCIRAGGTPPNISWSPGADWFVQKQHQGGLLLDIGIHMADLLRMIMGEAESAAGLVDTRLPTIDVPDNVQVLYRFRNGTTGVLELSWTIPGGAGLLEIYGTAGRIRMGFGGSGIELTRIVDGTSEVSTPAVREHVNSHQTFRDAILGKAPSLTPGEYGRRALALCLAALTSSQSGRFAKVRHFADEARIPQ